MRKSSSYLAPDGLETWYVLLGAFAVLIAGNAKLFLQRLGLIKSSSVVSEHVSQTVGNGLGVIDSFKATPGLVTFVTWSVIGLVTFSIVQAIARTSALIRYERELSSNSYVHPLNFNRQSYWKRILSDALLSFVFMVLLAVGTILYLVFVLPVGLNYTQWFVRHPSLQHITDLAAGVFIVTAGTVAIYALLKLVVWHHRMSQH